MIIGGRTLPTNSDAMSWQSGADMNEAATQIPTAEGR